MSWGRGEGAESVNSSSFSSVDDEYGSLEGVASNDSSLFLFFLNASLGPTSFGGPTTQDPSLDRFEEEELPHPTYYSLRYRIVGTVFQSIILLVGVLGNVLVILVVKKITWMQSPTNCYLVSLALADSIVLFSSVPNEIVAYFILGDEWLWGRGACAAFVFAQYLGVNASALSITAFTVERYIAICHPWRAQTMCTVHRAKRIIWAVWAFAFAYCSPWLWLTDLVPLQYRGLQERVRCTYALARHLYVGYYFADLLVFYLVPLGVSCVLYGLMARGLMVTLRDATGAPGANGHALRATSRASNTRVQVVKMLVVVVVLFAVLWMPYRVFVVYNSVAAHKYMEPWFLMFSKTMIYMNSAINPILYNALSVKFRRAFRRMLSCGGREVDRSTSSYYDSERSVLTVRFRNTRSSSGANTLRVRDPTPSPKDPASCDLATPSSSQPFESHSPEVDTTRHTRFLDDAITPM